MTKIEMINEMVLLQHKLDGRIQQEKAVEFDISRWRLALADELGELLHELKPSWCWWKDTVGTIDKQKALEELVDVWHFAISINNHVGTYTYKEIESMIETEQRRRQQYSYYAVDRAINATKKEHIQGVIILTYVLGYTIEDVYAEYLKKNQVNHARQDNNY